MSEEARPNDVLDWGLGIWRRRKWVALAAFVVPFAAVSTLSFFVPSLYRTSALVLVERQQLPDEWVKSPVTRGLETRLAKLTQDLLHVKRLTGLVEENNLYPAVRERVSAERLAERIRRDIAVDLREVEGKLRHGGTITFPVSFVGTDPQVVARVTNLIASAFLEENAKARGQQATEAVDFLERQLREVKGRLEEQEERLSAFKRRYPGETPEFSQANLMAVERLTTQLRIAGEGHARALERREKLLRQLGLAERLPDPTAAIDPSVVAGLRPDVVVGDPREIRLAKMRQDLAELLTRFSERYPDVIRAKAEIEALERQIAASPAPANGKDADPKTARPKETRVTLSPYVLQIRDGLAEVEAELRLLKAEEGRLRDELASFQRRLQNAPQREQEYQQLTRDYTTTTEQYRTLGRRLEEAQLADTLERRAKGEQFRVLQAAVVPGTPLAPNRFKVLLFGIAASLACAAGVVMLAEVLDSSLHSVEQLRDTTAVPILARIPRIVTEADARRRSRRFALGAVAVAVAVVLVVVAAYVTAKGRTPVGPFVQSLVQKG